MIQEKIAQSKTDKKLGWLCWGDWDIRRSRALMSSVFKWGGPCAQDPREDPSVERQGCAETIKRQWGVCYASGSHWDIVDPRPACIESGG